MNKNNKPLVLKYGGNAMVDDGIQFKILDAICRIKKEGQNVVIVHGGGPFIKEALQKEKIESSFYDGQRITSAKALLHIERTLKGQVNSRLVEVINTLGQRAVGLSGKDGQIAIAKKRIVKSDDSKDLKPVDLGFVGDIDQVNTDLLQLLLENNFIPVITCLASDAKGVTYNINADVFAGHIAGAMGAKEFLILTDVDGILEDIHRDDSLIKEVSAHEIPDLIAREIIKGGMIPKIEACQTAIKMGAKQVRIINGTKPEHLLSIMRNESVGTVIYSVKH